MRTLAKLPEEQRSELGKCQICPKWSFTSVTEQTRHRKMLHPEAKRDDVAPGPSKHTCNYNIEGNVCGEILKSQHLLYKQKEELGHKRVRSETAKNQLVESQKKRKKQKEEKAVVRQIVVSVWGKKGNVSVVNVGEYNSDDGEEGTVIVDEECNATSCIIEEVILEANDEVDWIKCNECPK